MGEARNLVVCADDYALTPGISHAIRELIAARRISATSVMTVSPHWEREWEALRPLSEAADIGLHLTLTDHRPLTTLPRLAPGGRLPSIKELIRASLLGNLDRHEIEGEISRQLERFTRFWGRPPDHIDGHHHVHQLPGVRAALLAIVAGMPREARPYLRSCREPLGRIVARGVAPAKAAVISLLGAGFDHAAARHQIATNQGFSGVYDFDKPGMAIGDLFARCISRLGPRPLMMVHPGYLDAELAGLDPVTTPRELERAYFAGPEWPALLARNRIFVGRHRIATIQA